MSQMTSEQKRAFITSTLEWYGFPKSTIQYLQKILDNDKHPIISDYLDSFLIPLISILFKDKRDGSLWSNPEGIKFRGLIQLCFQGYLSKRAWDTIWKLLTEEDIIYYSTTHDHGNYPLSLAAYNENLEGVMRLDTIYSQLLSKHPKRLSMVHLALRQTLLTLPTLIDLEQKQNQKLFDYLLKMCRTFSTPMESYSPNTTKLNKVFNYFIEHSYVDETKTTPLFDVFSELCVDYCFYENNLVVRLLSQFLNRNWDKITFNQFRDHVLDLLDEKHPKNSEAHQICLDTLVYLDDLAFVCQDDLLKQDYDVSEKIIDADKGSKASTKRTLLITGIFTAIGLALGVAVGVTLVITGVFAPVGLGILGATCTGIGVMLGFVGLGFGVAKWTQDVCDDEVIPGENNGSLKKLGGLGDSVGSYLPNSQPVSNYKDVLTPLTPITSNTFERESDNSNVI
jgi:hypothetical protein